MPREPENFRIPSPNTNQPRGPLEHWRGLAHAQILEFYMENMPQYQLGAPTHCVLCLDAFPTSAAAGLGRPVGVLVVPWNGLGIA